MTSVDPNLSFQFMVGSLQHCYTPLPSEAFSTKLSERESLLCYMVVYKYFEISRLHRVKISCIVVVLDFMQQ